MKQLISYLINEKNIQPENILYLDLEQYNLLKEIKNADDLERVVNFYLENIHKEGTVYLFIDEIQLIQNWELYVNGLRANDNKDFEIIIS
jgi:predicted AAA+ superfamily ATPase